MYLILMMLLVLIASYGLCGALVLFAERTIRPKGSETTGLVAESSEGIPNPASPG